MECGLTAVVGTVARTEVRDMEVEGQTTTPTTQDHQVGMQSIIF